MGIEYTLVRSDRKTAVIEIKADSTVVVRVPRRMATRDIERVVAQKAAWIEKHTAKQTVSMPPMSEAEIAALKEAALEDLSRRAARLAPLVGVTYARISIRAQRTLWGSCSAKGNLNFNCLLMLAPEEVRDYVVVHELCHRKELNHSAAFWTAVAAVMPSWKQHRRWLKENGRDLLCRLSS